MLVRRGLDWRSGLTVDILSAKASNRDTSMVTVSKQGNGKKLLKYGLNGERCIKTMCSMYQ
jgi:hypothetical protein